jgi:iron(III) transport system substrate-binding protein
MKSKKGKRLIKIGMMIIAEAAMLLLSSCGNSPRQEEVKEISSRYSVPEEKRLIVYTSHKEEVYLPIIREFENRTGIWVDLHAGGTAEMIAQVKEASENGACDIMFGGGIESYEASKDLFMPYETEDKEILDDSYVDPDNYWTPFTELPIVFIYNKKLVSMSEAPDSWEEIFDEKWKGQIAFADLGKSGTSYTIISTMQQLFNEDAKSLVPRFYDQLDGKVLSSSGDIIPQVSDGKFLMGITLEETAKKAINQGYDISMTYPGEGTSAVPDGCAIVKNAPHSYNAGKFIDFVVSYDTQKYAADNFYRRSIRTDINKSTKADSGLISFDIKKSAKEEAEVFTLWNTLTGQEGE